MSQSKRHSFIEACTQVGSGMAISFGSYALFAHLGWVTMSLEQNAWLTVYFTVMSLTRSYVIRRSFNAPV
jgi:hypothetical protein